MNKTEQKLVDAIESKDYDLAVEAHKAFTELKSTTDKQANDYFKQIQSMNDDVIEVEEVVEEVIEVEVEVEIEEVVEAPRVEKRGKHVKSVERKSLENDFENLFQNALIYNNQVKRDRNGNTKFAKRLVSQLNLIRKQVIR